MEGDPHQGCFGGASFGFRDLWGTGAVNSNSAMEKRSLEEVMPDRKSEQSEVDID